MPDPGPALGLAVDDAAGAAPFEQVRDQIRARVDDGTLAPGTRLPPVRGLATSLGLAANTVARAYKELEALGVVETRGRAGTVVRGSGVERSVREAAAAYVATARALGLDDAAALDAVRRALRA
ncbi:GntR family transcriptional regulator [Nocardioides zeicaulis]|uniref:GntR family transcriptional regulator n=1 Tax=Nocardioides zeicaulis TaxID=1776857 RepID=A0ABV6E480_9ACTN